MLNRITTTTYHNSHDDDDDDNNNNNNNNNNINLSKIVIGSLTIQHIQGLL